MSNKERYTQYCRTSPVPIYLHHEWLDAAAQEGGDWDVLLSIDQQGKIVGYWVYFFKRQWLWTKITMPPYIPYMGPILNYPDSLSTYDKISFENKVLKELIDQLPSFDDIRFKWSADYDNGLSFYWNGFRQETAYTYIIRDTSDQEKVYSQFKPSLQRQIKKAQQSLMIRSTLEVNDLLRCFTESMQNDIQYTVPQTYLKRLISIAQKHQQCQILEAVDEKGNVIGAMLLLTDGKEMLYLLGGYDHRHSDRGAMPLLFWHAIQKAGQMGLRFNFEGSMLPGVERFFRSFGAELLPVYTFKKSKFPYTLKG